jgi:hypothetical protein
VAGRKRKSDTVLVLLLACGASPEAAAEKAGVSLRTLRRRWADPAFRALVEDLRKDMLYRAAAMFTAATTASVKTIAELQQSAVSESVRLRAAKAIIELGFKMREGVALEERIARLEEQLRRMEEARGSDTCR